MTTRWLQKSYAALASSTSGPRLATTRRRNCNLTLAGVRDIRYVRGVQRSPANARRSVSRRRSSSRRARVCHDEVVEALPPSGPKPLTFMTKAEPASNQPADPKAHLDAAPP